MARYRRLRCNLYWEPRRAVGVALHPAAPVKRHRLLRSGRFRLRIRRRYVDPVCFLFFIIFSGAVCRYARILLLMYPDRRRTVSMGDPEPLTVTSFRMPASPTALRRGGMSSLLHALSLDYSSLNFLLTF